MIKSRLIILVTIVLATGVAILLDIPFLRQLLVFLCFTVLPGFLILQLLKVEQISPIKRFLLSVGLSISFLLFIGLLINALLPLFGFSRPLSTTALVLSLSPILLVLCLAAYWRSKESFQLSVNFGKTSDNRLLSFLLFPLLFPVLSILGSELMNTTGNNVVLLGMLCSMLIYTVLLACLDKRVPEAAYPLAIWMISMALLLMSGMMSNYPTGGDIHREYEGFKATSYNLYWDLRASPGDAMTACLSTSLLPTIYYSLVGVSKFSTVKIIYPLIASLIPLVCYVVYRNYMTRTLSFLSSFFFVAQIPFIYSLKDHMRIQIFLLFFTLFILLVFENKIKGWAKNAILITFLFSMVVSYYAFPVVLLYLLFCLAASRKLLKAPFRSVQEPTASMVALCCAAIFLWWSQLTVPLFNNYVVIAEKTLQNLGNLFVGELRAFEVQAMTTLTGLSLPETITRVVHNLTFVLITTGVIALIIGSLRRKHKIFDVPYLVSMAAMLVLLSTFVILPYISTAFSAHRVYLIGLVILAPAFIIAGDIITSTVQRLLRRIHPHKALLEHRSVSGKALVLAILAMQFLCASGLLHQFSGEPYSEYLNTTGTRRSVVFVHDSDVAAAKWLWNNTTGNFEVVWDWGPSPAGVFAFVTDDRVERVSTNREPFIKGELPQNGSYIFLRTVNVKTGLVYTDIWERWGPPLELAEFSSLFAGRNRIYAGGAEIYR
ncbi:DUF2206 domain-containing protein [Dehalococcoidia bacterium]|nr:DUF2206 domain-containing protein [Dehalococcoidia bacterium]